MTSSAEGLVSVCPYNAHDEPHETYFLMLNRSAREMTVF